MSYSVDFVVNFPKIKKLFGAEYESRYAVFKDILVSNVRSFNNPMICDLKDLSDEDRNVYSVAFIFHSFYTGWEFDDLSDLATSLNEYFEVEFFTEDLIKEFLNEHDSLAIKVKRNYSAKGYIRNIAEHSFHVGKKYPELVYSTLRTYLKYYNLSEEDVTNISLVLKEMISLTASNKIDYSLKINDLKSELKAIHANRKNILNVISNKVYEEEFTLQNDRIKETLKSIGKSKEDRESLLEDFYKEHSSF